MTITPNSKHANLLLTFLLLVLAASGGRSDSLDVPDAPVPPLPHVQTIPVFASVKLSMPTALVQAPDDGSRWFAIERTGRIVVFDDDTENAVGTTFLDISARVESGPSESGLLGIAFHPDFAINGEVFVAYTEHRPLVSVISRFRSIDNNQTLDPTSEEIILKVRQPRNTHNGANLVFGPKDGFLYAGFGDGGGSGDPDSNGQDTTTLLGSIIRIDVDKATGYDIPPDNPFAGSQPCLQGSSAGTSSCPEIFAWGLRNPWRFSFDSLTGDLWVGDVGQDKWEEVNRVEVGQNYGWNTREGAHCFPPGSNCESNGLVDPITEYDHSLGLSITGGFVYRGSAIPGLQGQYIFADYVLGRIWAVPADSVVGTAPTEIGDTAHFIASFGEGVDGELYVINYGTGTIHKIVPQEGLLERP